MPENILVGSTPPPGGFKPNNLYAMLTPCVRRISAVTVANVNGCLADVYVVLGIARSEALVAMLAPRVGPTGELFATGCDCKSVRDQFLLNDAA